MFKYILIASISFILGIITVVIFAVMKISSECSRKEEKTNLKKEYFNKNFNFGKEFIEEEKNSSK